MVIRDEKEREVMMRQIAGAVARRIIHKFDEGKELIQGEMIGMIKFGSRIDLLLPADADIKVKIGDKVRGAKSLIAQLK
jgi:phosphatidylserine decarboxylase